jgi:hypothetical protein
MTRIFTLWFLRIVFASNNHALGHGKILPLKMLRSLTAQYEIDRLDMAIEVWQARTKPRAIFRELEPLKSLLGAAPLVG